MRSIERESYHTHNEREREEGTRDIERERKGGVLET